MNFGSSSRFWRVLLGAALVTTGGCSSLFTRSSEPYEDPQADHHSVPKPVEAEETTPPLIESKPGQKAAAAEAESKETATALRLMGQRLDALEQKLSMVNDKLSAAQNTIQNMDTFKPAKGSAVQPHPIQEVGIPDLPSEGASDSQPDYAHGPAVEAYRNGLILMEAAKYSEAILAFTGFLRDFAEHPLAGSAQFYIGEAYFRQNEMKLAGEEYQRVVTSYEQSSHLPDALKRLAEVQEKLSQGRSAAKNRQLLLSMFPQSPAARDVIEAKPSPNSTETAGNNTETPNLSPKQRLMKSRSGTHPSEIHPAIEDGLKNESPVPTAPVSH